MKKQRGITLIALIITIIVLLIIAVVAINAITESSIIGHAEKAAKDYDSAEDEEGSTLLGYESVIGQYANSVTNGVTYTDEGVPVPAGFKVVEGTKDTGLVIENKTEGSQFVWIPVPNSISIIKYKYDSYYEEPHIIYGDEPEFETELKSMYREMTRSVNKYSGFYVGRYEISLSNSGKAQSKASTESVPVYSYSSVADPDLNDWEDMYDICKTYQTSSVKSSMMWGIQYDKMISWMGEAAHISIGDKRNKDKTCGTAPEDVIKNVYDIYGNCSEWTIEAGGDQFRLHRAWIDKYDESGTPNDRSSSYKGGHPDLNARLAIYIISGDEFSDELPETPESIVGAYGDIEENDCYEFYKDYTGIKFDGGSSSRDRDFTYSIEKDGTGTILIDGTNEKILFKLQVIKDDSGNITNKVVTMSYDYDTSDEYRDCYTTNGSTGFKKQIEDTTFNYYEDGSHIGYVIISGSSIKFNPIGTEVMINMDIGEYFILDNYIYLVEDDTNEYWSAYKIEGDKLISLDS